MKAARFSETSEQNLLSDTV